MKESALLKEAVTPRFIECLVVLLIFAALVAPANSEPAFPVKYSADNRYLVDQNETPFPIMGRTAWFVLSLSVGDYQTFVDDTVARGYNSIELHVLNHDPRGNNPPFCGNGEPPFLTRLDGTSWNGFLSGSAPDFTTPNEAYWSYVDGFLSYCESKGILVFFFPAYVGNQGGDQGWMREMVANGATKILTYGAWTATRYKNQKNLVWMMGGDYGTAPNPFTTEESIVEEALLTGIKNVPGQQSTLFSAEWTSDSIATDQPDFGAQMSLNGVYSFPGYAVYQGRRAYASSQTKPAFLLEAPFDEEGPDGNSINENATQPVRRFQWWGWLSTIGGYISGNGYVWPFPPGWQNHLDTQGARDMARLNAFMSSIAWHKLVPSGLNGMRSLITAGGPSNEFLSDYVAAAASVDGTLLVAYIPPDHSGPITVDMEAMSGPARARWFDPTSGGYIQIATGLPNSGALSFTPPGLNSAGAMDWVLILDGASPIPPTTTDPIGQSSAYVAPVITTQPANQTVAPGSTVFLTAEASGTPTPTYQWWRNGMTFPSWNGPVLTLYGLSSNDDGTYTVVATNSAGSATSAGAVVTVGSTSTSDSAPVFTTQPANQTAAPGSTVFLTAAASGTPAPTYQWWRNGMTFSSWTGPVLTLYGLSSNDDGTYTVVATNSAGSATSARAVVTVASTSTGYTTPVFTTQPASQTATAGSTVDLTAAASGTPTPTYQWWRNGMTFPSWTGPVLTLFGLSSNDSGIYSVVATNSAGSAMSDGAVITVTSSSSGDSAPVFTMQPANLTAAPGSTVYLTAAASGTPTPTYQWWRNGVTFAGWSGPVLTLYELSSNDQGNYTVVATNSAGSATSAGAVVTVTSD